MMKLNSLEESGPVEYIVIFFQVFPEALHYDRLTGTFTTVDSADKVAQNGMEGTSSPLYGATDEEREQLLQWAQRERLPLFLKWVVLVTPCLLTRIREFIHTQHRNTTRGRRPSVVLRC